MDTRKDRKRISEDALTEEKGMNLLIVDDEIVTTEVLKEQINRERLHIKEIYTAYNAAMAREILQKTEIEIVICDIEMPKENGLELLKWIRKTGREIEFLFLTSHEKFEYAFGAVKNGAANYLLKPVDMPAINNALFVVTEKINKKRQLGKVKEYWSYGKRRVISEFWRSAVLGEFSSREDELESEIARMGLEFNVEEKYILVFLHIRKEAVFSDGKSNQLNQFILDNILAETLTAELKMENIIHWEDGGEYYVLAISDIGSGIIGEKAEEIRHLLGQFYDRPIYAGYISDANRIIDLGNIRQEILAYDKKHMCDDGQIVFFSELIPEKQKLEKMLDYKFILMCLEKGERVKLLEYLQKMVAAIKKKDRSLVNMQYFQMDLIQSVGVYLHQQGMDLEILFEDRNYMEIQKKASTSELAMIRWNTYLVNKVFDSIQCREKSHDMVDILVDYMREHYEENISRSTLADLVHFSPEYVGKAFKKQMGICINDYLNKLRINKAKSMLVSTNYKIIDIALMVGFENLPYFSSVFKKYEGISPAEYKKMHLS